MTRRNTGYKDPRQTHVANRSIFQQHSTKPHLPTCPPRFSKPELGFLRGSSSVVLVVKDAKEKTREKKVRFRCP